MTEKFLPCLEGVEDLFGTVVFGGEKIDFLLGELTRLIESEVLEKVLFVVEESRGETFKSTGLE